MAWKEHEINLRTKQGKDGVDENQSSSKGLETLTIEFQHNNIIVRAIQPTLLLVLIGGVPPSRRSVFKITPEAYGGSRYPPGDGPESDVPSTSEPAGGESSAETSLPTGEDNGSGKKKAASIMSTMSQREKDMKIGALHIQRKKIDALTEFIRAEFDLKGFVMPDDSSFP